MRAYRSQGWMFVYLLTRLCILRSGFRAATGSTWLCNITSVFLAAACLLCIASDPASLHLANKS